MWTGLGFASLGFLIGNIVGLTSASVSSTLIGLLFAFAGGSAIALMHNLEVEARREATKAIAALSIACTIGIYFSVIATEHRLLSPITQSAMTQEERDALKVLRSGRILADTLREANEIDIDLANERISDAEAYRRLRDLVIGEHQ